MELSYFECKIKVTNNAINVYWSSRDMAPLILKARCWRLLVNYHPGSRTQTNEPPPPSLLFEYEYEAGWIQGAIWAIWKSLLPLPVIEPRIVYPVAWSPYWRRYPGSWSYTEPTKNKIKFAQQNQSQIPNPTSHENIAAWSRNRAPWNTSNTFIYRLIELLLPRN